MDERLRGSFGSQPADIDGEIFVVRSARGQFQDMEPAARVLQLATKPGSCLVVAFGEIRR
jgi:hypothetical protein